MKATLWQLCLTANCAIAKGGTLFNFCGSILALDVCQFWQNWQPKLQPIVPNDKILDNCVGSGSTCIACIRTNRRFIGIEKDEKYYNIAKERIDNEIHGK